ncbi:hypothetical protein [Verrucosispora sp. TAA-831]|uniref:hypothetical protein n=1 Tax=Verrucosispora sp. TAA-831 TaxID=3422227 RepID=UPI003D6E3FB7
MSHPGSLGAVDQPADLPSDVSGADVPESWLGARWGRLLAILLALGLIAASVVVPWSEVSLRVLGSRDDALINQDSTAALGLTEIGGWGWAYLAVLLPLVLLTLAATVLAGRAGRVAALAAGGALLAMSTVLVGAAHRVSSGPDETAARWAEVVRRLAPVLDDDYGAIRFGYDSPGLTFAVLGVATLAGTVLAGRLPGGGRFVLAGAGTLALLVGLAAPWVTVYGATATEVDRSTVRWTGLGTASVVVMVGTVALAAVVWWAAARRSTRWRLPLLLVTVPVAFAFALAHDFLELDPAQWQDAAERARFLAVTYDIRSAAELAQLAPLLLLVAMVLSWSAARRRARAR